tara:strand:+ start:812 stop:1021 length:210 start_codon:yes stop_codon:yes gene_type:complete
MADGINSTAGNTTVTGSGYGGNDVKHLVAELERTFKRPEVYNSRYSREDIAFREGQAEMMHFIRKNVRV